MKLSLFAFLLSSSCFHSSSSVVSAELIEVWLEAKEVDIDVGDAAIPMWTYNGTVPGPEIRGHVGDTLRVHFLNSLPEATTVHWHGVEVPALMDGSPLAQLPVQAGDDFVYEFPLLHASTHWYHPHINTDKQIHKGLYGALIIEDPNLYDEKLPEAEEVLFLSDILLNGELDGFAPFLEELEHDTTVTDGVDEAQQIVAVYNAEQQLNGRYGSHLLVDGQPAPVVGMDWNEGMPMRLRLINVANARFMRVSIPMAHVWRIGGDGGLLETPVEILPIDTIDGTYSNPDPSLGLLLTPGERAELIVQPMETMNANTSTWELELEWHDLPIGFHGVSWKEDGTGVGANHANPLDGLRPKQVLKKWQVTTTDDEYELYEPPSGLVTIKELQADSDEVTLEYAFGHGGAQIPEGNIPFFGQIIDTEKLDFARITASLASTVEIGSTHYMDVANADGYDHNFHMHGFFFQHLGTTTVYKNGTATKTPVDVLEWKDTLWLPRRPEAGGKTVQNLVMYFGRMSGGEMEENKACASGKEFDPEIPMSGGWLLHCHMLEHAEYGMQSFLQVTGCQEETQPSTDEPEATEKPTVPSEDNESPSKDDDDDDSGSAFFVGTAAVWVSGLLAFVL